jgi:hypothetical protein
MNSKTIILSIAFVHLFLTAWPQTVITHEKGSYVDSLNQYFVQTAQPLYLYISTKPNMNPTPLSNSSSNENKNPITPMYLDGNGKHTIQHFDAQCKKQVTYTVYADGKSPITQSSFTQSPSHIAHGIQYYGKNLMVRLTASDDLSGVNTTYYSINGDEYQAYTTGSNIATKEGANVLKYYSIDNVGNCENIIEKKFVVDVTPPKTVYQLKEACANNVISGNSIINLTYNDSISGVAKTFYKFDTTAEMTYNGNNIVFQNLPEGDHTMYFHSVDHVKNTEIDQVFNFFYDKTAPIVATDVLGDRFIVNEQIYFSGRTKLKITAVDNKVGVKDTKYSVDNIEFKKYIDPFYLPSKPGVHIIKYYAIDSLGNVTTDNGDAENLEYKHTVSKVYVDLTGPTMDYQYTGQKFVTRDTTFINADTKIGMSGVDNESGMQRITYTLDQNPTEIDYHEPIKITQAGVHKLLVIGYDNVNNRNFKPAFFVVDNVPPVIYTSYSVQPLGQVDSLSILPSYAQIYVAPTDNLTGIHKILYSVNDQPEKEYLRFIDGFVKGQKNKVRISVSDNLENKSETVLYFQVQ